MLSSAHRHLFPADLCGSGNCISEGLTTTLESGQTGSWLGACQGKQVLLECQGLYLVSLCCMWVLWTPGHVCFLPNSQLFSPGHCHQWRLWLSSGGLWGLGCDAWQERPKTHRSDRSWAWQVSAAVCNRIGSWVPAACVNCCILSPGRAGAVLQDSAIVLGRPDCEFKLDPSRPSELGQVSQLFQSCLFSAVSKAVFCLLVCSNFLWQIFTLCSPDWPYIHSGPPALVFSVLAIQA